jgi:hypothetical protein
LRHSATTTQLYRRVRDDSAARHVVLARVARRIGDVFMNPTYQALHESIGKKD